MKNKYIPTRGCTNFSIFTVYWLGITFINLHITGNKTHLTVNPFTIFYFAAAPFDKVSAIVEVSLPQASYFDIPQIGAKSKVFRRNNLFLY